MKRLMLALVGLFVFASPAYADPVSSAIVGIAGWYASISVVGQALVQIGVGLALSAASMGLQYLLSGSGKSVEAAQREKPGVLIPERDGLLSSRVVYGEQVVAGGIFFQKTVADSGSTGPDIYVLGVTISEGVCESLDALIINGEECALDADGNPTTAPWYAVSGNNLKCSFRRGTTDQAIDPIIAARFPSEDANFRQRGICTVVLELNYGSDADEHIKLWGAGGIPQLAFKIKGKRIYDALSNAQDASDPTTWTWSDNATLVEVDWLMSDMGFEIDPADIDWSTVKRSATTDNEWVETLAGFERRGTINGLVDSTERNTDVLASMIQQNRGLIRRTLGTYTVKADTPAAAICTVHQGLLVGTLSYQNEPAKRSAINRIVTQFYPAVRYNQATEIPYEDATLIAADGETLEQRVSLRFCDSAPAAQRLAYALVQENRVGRTVTGVFDIAVLMAAGKPGQLLEAGDVIWLEMRAPYADINGLYKINSVEVGGDFNVTLSMSGTSANVIDGWNTSLEQELAA